MTIAALNELGVPSAPREVADYAFARFAVSLDFGALASLRRDERRAWRSPRSQRPVYVVPALEGRRFLPARGKVALSNWPLERRLLGPWSERADFLRATANLARQLAWLRGVDPAAAERMSGLVARYAASVPGALGDGELDPTRIEQAASKELDAFGAEDDEWRAAAAERAHKQLNDEERLWGAPPPTLLVGGLG